jgi:CRISPR-associated protein Cmx8
MAKKAAKPAAPTSIDVRYDLHDLPSAQHKAGLAGLMLQIENMRERQAAGQLPAGREIPEIVEQTATTAVIRFTERSAQDLFDDLYDAETVEVRSKSKWPGAAEKRQDVNPDPKGDEPKRWFVYDTVQPTGHFLRNYTEGDKEPWHKLWRDMIYAVPRNKPMTRQAYKSRADDQPTREGAEAWKALLAREKARAKGAQATAELAGSLMLAVQAVTAEAVPFEDRVEAQLLLHFWVLTARVFVPQRVDAEGKGEFVGYSLAVPEVGDLNRFCKRYRELLAKLDVRKNLFRPAGAVIALPEQGPLEFLHNLDRLTAEKVLSEKPSRYVTGVEFFHMVVAGNNVKLRAHGRIPVEDRLIEEYGSIRRDFHNAELVAGLILALLRGHPWFAELDAPVHEREWSHLVHSAQERRRTPPAMTGFAWEVDRLFQGLSASNRNRSPRETTPMREPDAPPDAVDAIIYDLVRVYVRERACARAGIDPDKDRDWWTNTAEVRRDVCAKLFLEFRSRHGDEFVGYFTDTIASVAQWLDEDRFLTVSRALMRPFAPHDGPDRPRTRDDVKTLTMLALAAHSRSIKTRDAAAHGPNSPTTDNPEESAG